ncbi:hypothetical protein ON010_g9375 [Phytophthora cinnamomi]|nr:hypothetical protein ON010_g9375 [Phytophthora cinnamomi]
MRQSALSPLPLQPAAPASTARATHQAVQLQLRRDERCGVLRVGGRAGAAAVDVGRDVVDLLAVLVHDDGAARRARVGAQHHAILQNKININKCSHYCSTIARPCLVDDADDGGACLGGLELLLAARLAQQQLVAAAVVEAEAAVQLLGGREGVPEGVLRAAEVAHVVPSRCGASRKSFRRGGGILLPLRIERCVGRPGLVFGCYL